LILPFCAFANTTISVAIPGTAVGTTNTTAPGAFIANFYQFALMIGGILAFGVIVFGGILYMSSPGNPSGQSNAKEWIWGALTGLLLLAAAYLILNTINPQLLNLTLPTLNQVVANSPANTTPSTSNTSPSTSKTTSSGGTCSIPTSGNCTVANLGQTCMGSNAASAAQICQAESSNNPLAPGDLSTNGQPVSLGLFQINLTANNVPHTGPDANMPCTQAFNHSWHAPGVCSKKNPTQCGPSTITNPELYNECATAAKNVQTNITKACSMSNNGKNWNQWSTHTKCGL
jgi:hypothetical protein